MNRRRLSRYGAIAAMIMVSAGACTPASTGDRPTQSNAKAIVHSFAGGCSGTVLTDAEPPLWAQGGWSHAKGTPWMVPWAIGNPSDALAFVFANQLVAGASPRIDGSNNKVLWIARGDQGSFVVDGTPLGQSGPVVTVAGGPSIVDVPSAGCWTFRLRWGTEDAPHYSAINLDVLPSGTLPSPY